MKLWHIFREGSVGYDEYSDAVVAAETEEIAVQIHPGADLELNNWESGCWVQDPKEVHIKLLGEAAEGIKAGIICASFHAG